MRPCPSRRRQARLWPPVPPPRLAPSSLSTLYRSAFHTKNSAAVPRQWLLALDWRADHLDPGPRHAGRPAAASARRVDSAMQALATPSAPGRAIRVTDGDAPGCRGRRASASGRNRHCPVHRRHPQPPVILISPTSRLRFGTDRADRRHGDARAQAGAPTGRFPVPSPVTSSAAGPPVTGFKQLPRSLYRRCSGLAAFAGPACSTGAAHGHW